MNICMCVGTLDNHHLAKRTRLNSQPVCLADVAIAGTFNARLLVVNSSCRAIILHMYIYRDTSTHVAFSQLVSQSGQRAGQWQKWKQQNLHHQVSFWAEVGMHSNNTHTSKDQGVCVCVCVSLFSLALWLAMNIYVCCWPHVLFCIPTARL